MENFNRSTYENPMERRHYEKLSGFVNKGESVVFAAGLEHQPDARVLDLGVGGGRTTALLYPHVKDYIGVDYVADMVALAKRNQPYATFKVMDARDLSEFPDGRFDLVYFSYNGLDAVSGENRVQILAEVSRVLSPNGAFVFSTFNKDWEGFNTRRPLLNLTWTRNPVRMAARLALAFIGLVKRQYYIRFEETGSDYSVRIHPAHHFGNMIHTTTLAKLKSQLAESGFKGAVKLFSKSGPELNDVTYDLEEYFHVIAYKQATPDVSKTVKTVVADQVPEFS